MKIIKTWLKKWNKIVLILTFEKYIYLLSKYNTYFLFYFD